MTRVGCGMLVCLQVVGVSSVQLPSGSYLVVMSMSRRTARSRPPAVWNILYWIIFLYFVSRSLARPAHSLLAHPGVRPFPARSLATASAQLVCTREQRERVAESPPGISRQQHLDGAKCWHFVRSHLTAPPLELLGGIHN